MMALLLYELETDPITKNDTLLYWTPKRKVQNPQWRMNAWVCYPTNMLVYRISTMLQPSSSMAIIIKWLASTKPLSKI